jgi:hypothetical protein
MMSELAKFWKKKKKGKGHEQIRPPGWSGTQLSARGHWPTLRYLEGVLEIPILCPDGRIIDTPGYDAETGILYEPAGSFPPVPTVLNRDGARQASKQILDLVQDFPFAGPEHQAAWLAALLTPFARSAIAGPCPAFVLDANVARVGKSLLVDLCAIAATGREVARTGWPERDEELKKTLTSVLLAGDRLVLFDNIADTPFGGSAIDAVLTASTWKDRLLGKNDMTPELPVRTVFFASGNNVSIKGDTANRVVLCRLDSMEEHPEERQGFKYARLVEHAKEIRPQLVTAALTILRAYLLSNQQPQLSAFGSFEEWNDLVRGAVYWVTGHDPLATSSRKAIRAANARESCLTGWLDGWPEFPDALQGVRAGEARRLLDENYQAATSLFAGHKEPLKYLTLRNAMAELGDSPQKPLSAKAIGEYLRWARGKRRNGKYFAALDDTTHGVKWVVRVVEK